MFENELLKITKNGNVKWKSQEERFKLIELAMTNEGYKIRISSDDIRNKKYYISRSGTNVFNLIESAFRTQKQIDKYVNEFNRYEQYHTSIRILNRDYFEYKVIRKIVGNDINFNF